MLKHIIFKKHPVNKKDKIKNIYRDKAEHLQNHGN